jgi:hypothetical protein
MTGGAQTTRDGESVDRFVVVPGAGHASHPAPRFGDQMIEVRLPQGAAVAFREGQLLWVSGTLLVLPGNPNADRPLYRLSNARAKVATPADIPKYFR